MTNENTPFTMPVAPMYGGGYGGGMGFGGDWWGILLLIAILNGGFGFGMGGGAMWPMMMGGMGGFGMDYLYPWLNNSQHISDGFRDQQLQTSIGTLQNTVTSGFGDVQLGISGLGRQICETGNGITGAVRDGFYNAEIANNGRQMANMQQLFGVQSGIADLKYVEATEACATRTANASNTRDIIDAIRSGDQAIQDKLCQLELDGYKREADSLRQQLNMAQLAASQTAQTAQILAGQSAEIDGVYNRLKNCPVGTYSVCNPYIYPGQGQTCGCGGNFMN